MPCGVYRLRDPVPVDLAYLVRSNIYVFGIRGEGKNAATVPRR